MPNKVRMHISIQPELKEEVKKLARANGLDVSSYLRMLVKKDARNAKRRKAV